MRPVRYMGILTSVDAKRGTLSVSCTFVVQWDGYPRQPEGDQAQGR